MISLNDLYQEPLFRPPAEASSIILQITQGCSWNRCRFCEMYSTKTFGIKPLDEAEKNLQVLGQFFPAGRRLFLADGDVFAAGPDYLGKVLTLIPQYLPALNRISAYASARNLQTYSYEQLVAIRKAGLALLYVGIESGSNQVLTRMNKGITAEEQLEALRMAKKAGFKLSVMLLNGLGGKELMEIHARESANIVSALQPELLSTLVLSFPYGLEHFQKRLADPFTPLSSIDSLTELRLFIAHCQLENTVFRTDHASNYLVLKGGLNRDKDKFLNQIDQALKQTGDIHLREEWERGL
ncbi:radical SAM protein [Marinilabiliaceae bacterium JC017]|nr:radical SAM protein [Marinilabiliaceae bacterium JC017]